MPPEGTPFEPTAETYSAILSFLEEGVVVCRPGGDIQYVNPAASFILQRPADELIGLNMSILVKPDVKFAELFNTPQNPSNQNLVARAQVVTTSGEEKEIHVRRIGCGENSDLVAYIVSPVGLISTALGDDKINLKLIQTSRMNAIGDLVSGMAHEFNQPLSVISLNTGMLKRHFKDASDPYVDSKLDQILSEIERISNLVLQMRKFVRREEYDESFFHVRDAIDDTLMFMKYKFNRSHIILNREDDDSLPRILGRQSDFEQILYLVLQNAVDALTATPRESERRLNIRSSKTEDEIRLEIEDTGPGIPPHVLQNIFTPFHSAKSKGEGMGIGLAVCKVLADEMHMTITVSSTPGQGTTIRIHIPMSLSEHAQL